MNITINVDVKDEKQKNELEQYLIKQAKKFLSEKEDVLELVEVDYDGIPEEVKKSFDEVEKEYQNNWLKNFNYISLN